MSDWWIYKATGKPHPGIEALPDPPNWRTFKGKIIERTLAPAEVEDEDIIRHIGRGKANGKVPDLSSDEKSREEIEIINAALFLRRPLLVTGKPGSGKSSLARVIAHELQLGSVLRWPITTRSTLAQGLYSYDAIGRLQDTPGRQRGNAPDLSVGKYLHLGPLGTALLPTKYPRVLLIDEIDKSDIDLPNDLLNIFEEGEFEIPELMRIAEKYPEVWVMPHDGRDERDRVPIQKGRVQCAAFPFIVLTSNGERSFPPAFLRRCLRLEMRQPGREKLAAMVQAQLGMEVLQKPETEKLLDHFLKLRETRELSADQLLNVVYILSRSLTVEEQEKEKLYELLLRNLSTQSSSSIS